MAVGLALGSASAGVGSNLIAEQFQRWRDQAEPPSEAQVATWVESQARPKPKCGKLWMLSWSM